MDENRNRSNQIRDMSLIVRSDWSVGPRTAAWDRLWRFVLGGLGPVPPTDGHEQPESEVGDA